MLFDTSCGEFVYKVKGKLLWMHVKCHEAIKEKK